MSKIKITFRQKVIISMLIENYKHPKRIKDIARELGVSSRTITRELVFVEKFLLMKDIKFIKKSGVGVFLDSDENKLIHLRNILDKEYSVGEFTKNERILSILESILELNSVIKSAYFLNKFKISYATLIKDLNSVKNLLNRFQLNLVRRKGIGIYVQGDEEKIRQALSYLIYEKFSGKNLFLSINNTSNQNSDKILKFIDSDIINKCKLIVDKAFKHFNLYLLENVYVSIVVHLSLSVYRIRNNFYCVFEDEIIHNFSKCIEFTVSSFIMNEARKEFSIGIYQGEICYISMHLRSYNIARKSLIKNDFDFEDLYKIKLAGDIIRRVEDILNIQLGDCVGLFKNLSIHLGPAIGRLMMNMNIRNPFLDMIKVEYSDIFNATCSACEVLEEITFCKIPESEVAYITMHIVAAYESKRKLNFTYRVIVCCETGMGVSRFLSNKIMSNFPNILVVGIVSSFNVTDEVKSKRVDFVISTIDIENYDNYIKVSPRFTLKDIDLINSRLENSVLRNEEFRETNYNADDFINIDCINELGNIVKLINNNFKIGNLFVTGTLENIVKKFVFNTVDANMEEIYQEVLNRERISSTFMKDLNLILFHTISEFSENILIGSYFLNSGVRIYDGVVDVIFYFIVPSKLNTKTLRDVIGELTSSLVKDRNFTDLVKKQDKYGIKKYVECILHNYYVNELRGHIKNFESFITVKEDC